MLRNYFKIALRNLWKDKPYTGINVAGLSVGMACFVLIALFIGYEMSYDTGHEKADRIYRVVQRQQGNEYRGTDGFTVTPRVLAPTLESEFPEVEVASTLQVDELLLTKGEKAFYEKGLFADQKVFEVFTIPVLEGAGKEALQDPNAILLTQSLARKYFAGRNPVGQTILLRNERPLTVRGIVADVPHNRHFTFDYITSPKNLPYYQEDGDAWVNNNYLTYLVLPEGYDYRKLEKKLASLDRYLGGYARVGLPFKPAFFLQPLLDIHLHSHLNFEKGDNGDIRYVYLFASVALIILLLASINYTNLTTAQSARRAKEVGMRKVIGAGRRQLVYQFLGESLLLTTISFGLALVLAKGLLPAFNQMLGQTIPADAMGNPWLLITLLAIALLVSGISGLYPAVFLSALSPIHALKGGLLRNHKRGTGLRNLLVVGQFAASTVLAIGSVVIYQQLRYIQNKELGYNRDQVVYVPYRNVNLNRQLPLIRDRLLANPRVEKVSFPVYMPLNMHSETIVKNWEGNHTRQDLFIYRNYVDYDFLELFRIRLKEGRNFSPDHPTDSIDSYILNEAAVKALGWQSAVGKGFEGGKVIGLVKDFHFQPFDLAIKPLYLKFRKGQGAYDHDHIAIKVKTAELAGTLAGIQKTIKTHLPGMAYEHRFMDEAYAQLYDSERRLGHTFNVFTLLALFIACLGLFGLVSHHLLQRTKEIGIRKVLGASVPQLVGLVSQEFVKLIGSAFLIATPVAWYAMHRWLGHFAYRIDISWWVFAGAGVLSLGIALLTVSFQGIRAALANPVDSLRSE
jgi:putative ABC transport system permease protein